MPPTQFSIGNVNIVQPYEFGQSGTERPDPVLVTSPPAKIRTAVDAAVSSAKRWSSMTTTSRGLPAEREGDVLRFLGVDRHASGLRPELLVPGFDGVGAGRQPLEREG